MNTLEALLERRLRELAVNLPGDTLAHLLKYVELLMRWNQTYNLTAVREPLAMIDRHIVDSLAVLPYCQRTDLIDIGTGPGVPGLVLALTQPYEQVWLVDSNGKKARFLRECLRHFPLPQVTVHECRAEQLPTAQFGQIISRAYSDLSTFIANTRQLLARDGRWLAMKGKMPHAEIAKLPADVVVESKIALQVPGADGERCLVTIGRRADPHS